jgi:hypothetical protein
MHYKKELSGRGKEETKRGEEKGTEEEEGEWVNREKRNRV